MTFVGIDPGKTGAIAAICADKVATFKMPLAGKEIDGAAVAALLRDADIVAIEKVNAMPSIPGKDGNRRTMGSQTSFAFGCNYGLILGVCAGLGKRVELVTPQAWKALVLAGTKKDKDAARDYVARAYPSSKRRTEGEAEALCIAEWCRRKIAGVR